MDNQKTEKKCQSGEQKGIGVYLCTHCNFAVVGIRADYVLPDCPCCENNAYKIFLNAEPELV
ncbi:hypothetical protein DI392_15455 [Vibrio albus]|uniref:Rubredoxin-like domain-containing protein n=1 Tax=Vibrio albus TaxID=2200953 RepID=A0A2U3B6N6_9VIBR|nr:hypothetical protein DI392_15455 [Vibrio albus]